MQKKKKTDLQLIHINEPWFIHSNHVIYNPVIIVYPQFISIASTENSYAEMFDL